MRYPQGVGYSSVSMRSIGSVQCLGDSGTASLAKVILISVPQLLQRYLSLTDRSSPGGGGSGTGLDNAPRTVSPTMNIASEIVTETMTLTGLS